MGARQLAASAPGFRQAGAQDFFDVLRRVREWLLRLLRRDAVRRFGLCFVLVSPAAARCLLTIRAATSSSRPLYRFSFLNLRSSFFASRSRFGLAPRGMAFSCCFDAFMVVRPTRPWRTHAFPVSTPPGLFVREGAAAARHGSTCDITSSRADGFQQGLIRFASPSPSKSSHPGCGSSPDVVALSFLLRGPRFKDRNSQVFQPSFY